MKLSKKMIETALNHYKIVISLVLLVSLVLGGMILKIKVDTDPENMLSKDNSSRIFHNETKERFFLNDLIVLGIINNNNPEGIFNVESLKRVYKLAEFSKNMQWRDANGTVQGVIAVDVIAPSNIDHISSGELGEVNFDWLMPEPPSTENDALMVRDRIMSNPLLRDTLVSEDGKALCLYLPISKKDISWDVYQKLEGYIQTLGGDEEYHITGLPVAEDTFGVEMFSQMAISAPLAMLVIFILMWFFFRKLVLILSPMIIALVTVICTMGLMIGMGYPVHIMSSMIPIFLMPISVVDSVHILSEFFDRYTEKKGRRQTIKEVVQSLFVPMLYTSLTSAAGFASLALAPIPPVQVFGIFVALGIALAWLLTIIFIPAYMMAIPEKSLRNFGRNLLDDKRHSSSFLNKLAPFTYSWAKPIMVVVVLFVILSAYGITKIHINDNPVKWFTKSHKIRQADIKLNDHFGGTYMAYLVLDADVESKGSLEIDRSVFDKDIISELQVIREKYPNFSVTESLLYDGSDAKWSQERLIDFLIDKANKQAMSAKDDDAFYGWDELAVYLEDYGSQGRVVPPFKRPEVLRYINDLQNYLDDSGLVGKSNSISDMVKKIYQELRGGSEIYYVIPDNSGGVSDALFQYQSSHKPNDLWHMVTYDYNAANLWLQLTSGDNYHMEKVIALVDEFFQNNPPPEGIKIDHQWAGLTYINTVWQDRMVSGMLESFLGSFIIVFIMMTILFRSPLWGIICMLPLTVTILGIYGIIGLIGKDYDMPVAVLSSLTLGMSVDFAIHFLERARSIYRKHNNWQITIEKMSDEPARAIFKNLVIISLGFLPLLAAPLMPYKTVGIFICSIMILSGVVTLVALPAVMTIFKKALLSKIDKTRGVFCNCFMYITVSLSSAILIALSFQQYFHMKWSWLALLAILFIVISTAICGVMSRRKTCGK